MSRLGNQHADRILAIPVLIHRVLRRSTAFLPGRWRLPAVAHLDLLQGVEPECRWLRLIGPCRGIAIDVGANYGLYSYALSKLYSRVVAFEPNPKAVMLLHAWKCPNVDVVETALSSEEGDSTLYVPVENRFEMLGWGSLDPDNCPGATHFTRFAVHRRSLDSFGLNDVGFIKIDVEGHELQVLQGAAETITRYKPNLLIEVRQNQSSVYALMKSWGYAACRLDALAGVRGSPGNVIFRPNS